MTYPYGTDAAVMIKDAEMKMMMRPGTVIEWFCTNTPSPMTQRCRVVKPTCANSGSADHAGECSCAPPKPEPKAEVNSAEKTSVRKRRSIVGSGGKR